MKKSNHADIRPRSSTLSCWIAIFVSTVALTGCGPTSSGAAEDTRPERDVPEPTVLGALDGELDDALLSLRVRMQLLEHLQVDALGVGVGIEGGEVVLWGDVKEAGNKSLAKEVALSVDGVDSVSNRIEVARAESGDRPPISRAVGTVERELADAVLLTRIKLELAQALGSSALDIDVDVKDGVVSLRGRLPDGERRKVAVRTAEAVKGVEQVHDLLDTRS